MYYDDQNGDGIINGADRVWIYFGLRRGGKSYYALDITNKTAPVFKWKITNETGTGKICNGTSTAPQPRSSTNWDKPGRRLQ